jgi:hypothetical protein
MRSFLGIACVAMPLAVGGCATGEPIENVSDAPVVAAAGKNLTRSDVAVAIQRAGRSIGWQLIAEGPGVFTGRLQLRGHLAVVEIEYDSKAYSIRYRDSANLDAKDGQIHKAYNHWVENLDQAIRAELRMF